MPVDKKICYLVAEDWYFCSHRLELARAAKKAGYEVFVVTKINDKRAEIEAEGFRLINLDMNRHGKNILKEAITVLRLIKTYRSISPDIVHHIALKPSVYGTLATVFSGKKNIVNTVAGLGYIFKSKNLIDKIISALIIHVMKITSFIRRPVYIVQNIEDKDFLVKCNLASNDYVRLVKGSGVDPAIYKPSKKNNNVPVVLLASRLLWRKGVADYVAAADIIRKKGLQADFFLAGKPDIENPDSIPISQLEEWDNNGVINYIGHNENMPDLLSKIDIVCLPTNYGEGVPKVLIEAASCAIPIVAANIAGCREIVKDEVNGYLTPVKDPESVASAIERLLLDGDLRIKMGNEGRRIVENDFYMNKINSETLETYRFLLN